MSNKMPVIHLWSPESFHSEGYVVGNYEGLIKLRSAIDRAIAAGAGKENVFIGDGEGFDLYVFRIDDNLVGLTAVPYRDDMAAEKRERTVFPWDMVAR